MFNEEAKGDDGDKDDGVGVSARLREQHIEVLRVVRDLQRAHDGDQHESSWLNTQSDVCDVPVNDQTKVRRVSPCWYGVGVGGGGCGCGGKARGGAVGPCMAVTAPGDQQYRQRTQSRSNL